MCTNDLDWILDNVAVGNIVAGSDFKRLQNLGINVIVCVMPELPFPKETYIDTGFSFFHIPIDDSPDVNIEQWFDDVSYFIMAHRLMDNKVLIHCHAGMSRSTSFACAFIMNLFLCDFSRALYWVRHRRPCTNINPGFLKQLARYGERFSPSLLSTSNKMIM
jgi:protein-tyrosine phosphatase